MRCRIEIDTCTFFWFSNTPSCLMAVGWARVGFRPISREEFSGANFRVRKTRAGRSRSSFSMPQGRRCAEVGVPGPGSPVRRPRGGGALPPGRDRGRDPSIRHAARCRDGAKEHGRCECAREGCSCRTRSWIRRRGDEANRGPPKMGSSHEKGAASTSFAVYGRDAISAHGLRRGESILLNGSWRVLCVGVLLCPFSECLSRQRYVLQHEA